MAYNVLDVARYIINRENEKGHNISNLKLQKMLYFVQATFLVNENKSCFNEEIEAWDFGPVVPSVYHEFKRYGSRSIPYINKYIDLTNGIWESKEKEFDMNIISKEDQYVIDKMVDECSEYTANQLVEITHSQSPWMDSYVRGWNNVISRESICNFFRGD